jgi:diaminohydroxyphosphoribosylaminopyrimidine deaminase / 5-amino-6-(5-phosphoribosylamino)uracil reductase
MKVTLKLATSVDGKIATASGESRWITGQPARAEAQMLRAVHSAVLVGVETVIADDPELTVRLEGYVGFQPSRIVMDSRQRMPIGSKLALTARQTPTIVLAIEPSNKRLTDAGVNVVQVDATEGRVDPRSALRALEAMKMKAVMIEGGGQVAASFLAAGLVDNLEWFRAPMVIGEEGRPAIGAFVLKDLAAAPRFRRISVEAVGDDLWERYEKI